MLDRAKHYFLGVTTRRWLFLVMAFIVAGMAVAGAVVPATGFHAYHTDGPTPYIAYSYFHDITGTYDSDNWPVRGGRFVVFPALLSGVLFLLNLRSDDGLLRAFFATNGLLLLLAYWLVDLPTQPRDSGMSDLSAGPGQLLVLLAGLGSLVTALSHLGYSEWKRSG